MHEAQKHDRTSFVTLTYDDRRAPTGATSSQSLTVAPASAPAQVRKESPACDSSLTRGYSLVVPPQSSATRIALHYPHVQLFLRKLRKTLRKRRGLQGKIRFYMCGEYGDELGRPHYHICLFGEDFREDRYEWRHRKEFTYWRSPTLEEHWPHGNSEIGALTIESAAYVARYVMKKMTGKKADDHYMKIDPLTGERYWLPPEFSVMSRRPGIGADWFKDFSQDVYPGDYVIHKGRKLKPPRYYDKLLKLVDEQLLEDIQNARAAGINHSDNTPARLAVREDVVKAKLAFTKRNLGD